jgi:hypothetical protein
MAHLRIVTVNSLFDECRSSELRSSELQKTVLEFFDNRFLINSVFFVQATR